jgi:hypothetical protein
MPQTLYCWRCRMDIPMLDDEEWTLVAPYLSNAVEQIKRYRQEHGVSLAEANRRGYGQRALQIYEELTGFAETNPDALWHHRASLFGAPCADCGNPLRTPSASYCAECGGKRQ